MKGDKNSYHQVFPLDTLQSIRFVYGMIPVNVRYKILPSKDIYFQLGVSGNYLISTGDIENVTKYSFPTLDSFGEKIGLSFQTGFSFKILNRFMTELSYSQDISNIIKIPISNIEDNSQKFRNQAFELTLIYRL